MVYRGKTLLMKRKIQSSAMIRNLYLLIAALFLTVSFGGLPEKVRAKEPAYITYEVQQGDTLLQFAQNYMMSEKDWRQVQKINQVKNPRFLSIGKSLKVPRRLLRYNDVILRVQNFSGEVLIDGVQVQEGTPLNVQSRVSTGANGFVTFTTQQFGGRVSIPSNSSGKLLSSRRYILQNTLFIDFEVARGRSRIFSPKLQGQDQLLLTTPRAVTAVRGTQFRVAFDPDEDRSITEVTEGIVGVDAGDASISAEQGFGVSSSASGLSQPEALLPSPSLIDPTAIQMDDVLEFKVTPDPKAKAHRFLIARDVTFLDVINSQIVTGDTAIFEGLEDGRYHVRARAISESGIEGFSEGYSFRRKRLGVSGSSQQSDLLDGFVFKWLSVGEGNARFAFQLWADGNRDDMLIDETGLSTTALVLTDLAPGAYKWRIAVIVPDEEEGLLKVWSPEEGLNVSE